MRITVAKWPRAEGYTTRTLACQYVMIDNTIGVSRSAVISWSYRSTVIRILHIVELYECIFVGGVAISNIAYCDR